MKAPPFDYARAKDASHAVELLREASGHARPLAGGQSLGPMLNLRLARPDLLVDVSRCPDLRGHVDEGDAIVYGAALTHAEIEDGAAPDATGGWLRHAARRIAYRAVRNRGTLGGSLAHADPAADWPVVLLAFDAEVIVQGPAGLRALALDAFLTGPFATALAPDEIVIGVRVAKCAGGCRVGYRKLGVKAGEFALAFAVAVRDIEHGTSRAVVGAIERTPLVLVDIDPLIADPRSARETIAARLPGLEAGALRRHAAILARAIESLELREAPS